MAETTASRPRPSALTRGGSALAPGLPQVLAGRWGSGVAALAVWAGLLWLLLSRPNRVWTAALSGRWDEKVSAIVLVVALAGVWLWSWFDVAARTRTATERGPWRWTRDAFGQNRLAVAGAVVVLFLYILAVVAPLVAPYDPLRPGALTTRMAPPSGAHLMGTDQAARDVFSRLLYGARISLGIGFLAVAISSTLGTLVGAVAGYVGGWVDSTLMRLVDLVIAFPRLILLVTIVALFRPSVPLIVVVLGLTLWPTTARVVRGEVLSVRERPFVEAARALGYSRRRIILRHVVPNVLAPVIVAATLGIGDTIVLEAGLSFLGLGVQPPAPSWGTMVADGRNNLLGAWWLSTFPGLAIVFTVLAFNLMGDGLRDALDPRSRS